jgi:hypothetical protein
VTPRDFVYWLQGYYEILDPKNQSPGCLPMGALQSQCIRDHLQLVFQHMQAEPVKAPSPIPSSPYITQADHWFQPNGAVVC